MRRLVLLALALLAAPPAAGAEGPLVLELCEGYVATAEVIEPAQEGKPFGLAIRLLPDAARGFAELTADHVGRTLEIHIGPEHVLRAAIRQPIPSGLITTGGYASREEAEKARAAALATRTRPCAGADPGAAGGRGSGDPPEASAP